MIIRNFTLVFITFFLVICSSQAQSLKVTTYNILNEDSNDNGRGPWNDRKAALVSLLVNSTADVIALQEDTKNQQSDIICKNNTDDFDGDDNKCVESDFNDIYKLAIDAGGAVTEGDQHLSIFYNPETLSFVETNSGHELFTPGPIRGRGFSWAKFEHKILGKEFYVYNLHATPGDGAAETNRQNQFKDLAEHVWGEFPQDSSVAKIITGDFNSNSNLVSLQYLINPKDTFPQLVYNNNFQQLYCLESCDAGISPFIDHFLVSDGVGRMSVEVDGVNVNGITYPSDHEMLSTNLLPYFGGWFTALTRNYLE